MSPALQRALARVAQHEASGVWLPDWGLDPALDDLRSRGLVWGGDVPRLSPEGRAEAERLPGGFRPCG